jgi:hypothetical protein
LLKRVSGCPDAVSGGFVKVPNGHGRHTMPFLENVSMGWKLYLTYKGGEIMKKKLCKNRKQRSKVNKVVLYTTEGADSVGNSGCSYNSCTNKAEGC